MRFSFDLNLKFEAFKTLVTFPRGEGEKPHRTLKVRGTPPPQKLTVTLDLSPRELDNAEQRALLMRLADVVEEASRKAAAEFKG